MFSPNYTDYSMSELNDALDSINSEAYPENYKRLLKEIKSRNKSTAKNDSELNIIDHESPLEGKSEKVDIKEYWNPKTAKEDQKSIFRLIAVVKLSIIVGVFSIPAFVYSYLIDEY